MSARPLDQVHLRFVHFALGLAIFINMSQSAYMARELFGHSSAFVVDPGHVGLFTFWMNDAILLTLGFSSGALIALWFMFARGNGWKSVVLFYFLMSMVVRNPLVHNVSFQFMLFSLVIVSLVHFSRYYSVGASTFREIYLAAVIIGGLGYTFSGIYKLQSPVWISGEALCNIYGSALFFCHFRPLGMAVNHFVLIIEVLALPMQVHFVSRMLSWILLTGMHFFIIIFHPMKELSMGLLAFQVLIFDQQWWYWAHDRIINGRWFHHWPRSRRVSIPACDVQANSYPHKG